jgi:hypothetical protein
MPTLIVERHYHGIHAVLTQFESIKGMGTKGVCGEVSWREALTFFSCVYYGGSFILSLHEGLDPFVA